MSQRIVLVMDCGATNVRTIAVNEKGELLAMHSVPNNTQPDPHAPGCLIWDVEEIWRKLVTCTKKVLLSVQKKNIVGVTVTTFGVDGAPVKADGTLLYPVISWACGRTQPVMNNIGKYMPLSELYRTNGLQPMHFNTINKLIWFRENKPEILEKMDHYVLIPSIFLHKLCGQYVTDTSMAGTSMLTDINTRGFSDRILKAVGVSKDKFPHMVEPGRQVGTVTKDAEKMTGIPEGVTVVAAGHDTQFAIFGSGAMENEPVLSSGTWEILMARTRTYRADDETLARGMTTEYDALPGMYNMGVQWVASGALEWLKKMFYAQDAANKKNNIYDTMIGEARTAGIGANGVYMHPCFVPKVGPSAIYNTHGTILGLTINSTRGDVYRAMLESLVFQTKEALAILEEAGKFKASSVICVGGGSKNALWNQMRADVLGIPVKLIEQKETTVLGAALFALVGAGVYKDAMEARNVIAYKGETFEPSKDGAKYQKNYERFISLAKNLAPLYR